MQFNNFVRRLGQWHLYSAMDNDGLTLCGTPMLSNNYEADFARHSPEALKPCKKCHSKAKKLDPSVKTNTVIVDEMCSCKHPRSEHEGSLSKHLADGHGSCKNLDCDCEKFTWISFVTIELPIAE
jgi:hypothetical protein